MSEQPRSVLPGRRCEVCLGSLYWRQSVGRWGHVGTQDTREQKDADHEPRPLP